MKILDGSIAATVFGGIFLLAVKEWIPLPLAVVYASCTLFLYLIWRFLNSFIIKWIEADRQILVGAYLVIFLVPAFVPLYFTIFYWYSHSPFSVNYLIPVIASLIVLVIFGTLLYRLIHQVVEHFNFNVSKAEEDLYKAKLKAEEAEQSLLQATTKSRVERQYEETPLDVLVSGGRTIQVRCLHMSNKNDPDDPISLSWDTFTDGIEFLWKQIHKKYHRMLAVDLYVGINYPGTAIASLIAASRGGDLVKPVEFVSAKEDIYLFKGFELRKEGDSDFQTVKPKRILVFDFVVKSGRAIREVEKLLRGKYGEDIKIKSAVLVAPLVNLTPDINKIDMETIIKNNKIYSERTEFKPDFHIPDFLAFISYNQVRLPHDIR